MIDEYSLVIKEGRLFHAIAGKAVAFGEALKPEFKEYGRSIVANAKMFSEAFINRGVEVVSGKTDNHLFTLNVYKSYGITGKEAEKILGNINITVNKNTIPNDSLSPMVSSGIRIGTAAMTSRKFTKWEQLAEIIHTLLSNFMVIKKDKTLLKELKQKVKDLSAQFPIITEY